MVVVEVVPGSRCGAGPEQPAAAVAPVGATPRHDGLQGARPPATCSSARSSMLGQEHGEPSVTATPGTLPLFSHPDPTQIPPITAEDSMLSCCQIWCIRCLIFPARGLWRPSSCGLVFVVKCIFVSREGMISPFRKWWQANLGLMMPNCWMLQLLGCNRDGCLPGSWVAGAESGFYLRSITILIP